MEWPIDLLIEVVWVTYLIVLRRHHHEAASSRTSTWPTGSTCPSSWLPRCCTPSTTWRCRSSLFTLKSYSLFAGTQDAMTQWWYGHNAVGFFLTAAFLGMMYYFVPKQAGRPIYSYRLSIVHFWALSFMYMWVGASPPALDRAARLDLDPGRHLLHHAADAFLGRHDQRHHDPVRRVGQTAYRPDHALHDRRAVVLRHVHLRRSDDVAEGRQRAVALHRLDRGPRALRRAGLGGDDLLRFAVSHDPQAVGHQDVQRAS